MLLWPGTQALGELTGKGVGCLLVVDPIDTRLLGTFTDGDLRRSLQGRGAQVLALLIYSHLTWWHLLPASPQQRDTPHISVMLGSSDCVDCASCGIFVGYLYICG